MTNLVIAEHDNVSVRAATLNTVAAAQKIGGDVHVLILGHNAKAAARFSGEDRGAFRSAARPMPATSK
ncbi:hypothetical protein NK8_84370 (plasmid) [Caballeronia sp. NK8]|nr:hypothetical protein NK8_84370 [Caballeronia sp. NK8]